MEHETPRVRVDQPTCPFCRVDITPGEAQLACNACRAWHHAECWAENRSTCGACGGSATGLAPPAVARPAAGPVRYRTRSGRQYEYRVPLGAYFLQRALLAPAAVLPFALAIALLMQALPRSIEPYVTLPLALLAPVGAFLALRWHDRRSRRYL